MATHFRWNGYHGASPEEIAEADSFHAELLGEATELDSPSESAWSIRWLPVTYRTPQGRMAPEILGVVVHTTNHPAGEETLERFQRDWQGGQFQSAHFVIDRDGNVGQYRSVDEVAWHILGESRKYIGIEHIAKHNQALTDAQLESSASLIHLLWLRLGIPVHAFDPKTKRGIAIHIDFGHTGCGQSVFWAWHGTQRRRSATYHRLVQMVRDSA